MQNNFSVNLKLDCELYKVQNHIKFLTKVNIFVLCKYVWIVLETKMEKDHFSSDMLTLVCITSMWMSSYRKKKTRLEIKASDNFQ